jgi:histidinol dehydrogenase
MLGIPAKLAGCKEIVICTPPGHDRIVNPLILYTAQLIGISQIYKVGGAQAIAAMAYGTESIPEVYKIFGPGNQYVTKAKELVQQDGVAIDMPAGPSEVLVIADRMANPEFIASDLLSQAEHGPDSQVIMLTDNMELLEKVESEVDKQMELLPRKDIALKALENSKLIMLKTINDCVDFSNLYAPEHLIINVTDAASLTNDIKNAGSVFLGVFSCESAGDYASGTNHTLPTNGFARNYSGVSVDSFLKKITFQEITSEGIKNLGPVIELMAQAESLWGHKNAVSVRLKSLENV